METQNNNNKHVRDPRSISCLGLVVTPGTVQYLTTIRDGGLLEVRATGPVPVLLPPSIFAQQTHPDQQWPIPGDDKQASYPLGGYDDRIQFRLVTPPASLSHVPAMEGLSTRWVPVQELLEAVPRPPTSDPTSTKLHTLAFNRTRWRVADACRKVSSAGMYQVDLRCCVGAEEKDPTTTTIYRVDLGGVAVHLLTCFEAPASYDGPRNPYVARLSISQCLSLLQKCVRHRPVRMRTGSQVMMRTDELIADLVRRLLLGGGGYFIPHLSLFVSARQAVIKRLMIIAAEDSAYDAPFMARCAGFCLLARNQPQWSPDARTVAYFCDKAVGLWRSDTTSEILSHRLTVPPSFGETTAQFHASLPYLLLTREGGCGGMEGDRRMLGHLIMSPALQNIHRDRISPHPHGFLDTCLAFDQHVSPRIACLLPPDWIRPVKGVTKPFSDALRKLFEHVTGVNPRRPDPKRPISAREKRHCMSALRMCEQLMVGDPITTPPTNPKLEFVKTIFPDSMLCGMVAPVTVKVGRRSFLVTLSMHHPRTDSVVTPKPSRDKKKKNMHMATSDQVAARRVFYHRLRHEGLPIILDPYKGRRLFLEAGQFRVGPHQLWSGDSGANAHYETVPADRPCPVLEDAHPSYRPQEPGATPIVTLPEAMQLRRIPFPWEEPVPLPQPHKFHRMTFLCARAALTGSETYIAPPAIARDGSIQGTGMEALTWQFMYHLSEICPGALQPDPRTPFAFRVRSVRKKKDLLHYLTAIVQTQTALHPFPPATHIGSVELYDVQRRAIQDMLTTYTTNKQMPFLCLPPGRGKTMCVLNFLHCCREQTKFNMIVWTIPGPSAAATIYRQVQQVGWDPVLLFPTKGIRMNRAKALTSAAAGSAAAPMQSCLIKDLGSVCRNRVLIVEHDHLWRIVQKLAPYMPLAAFVCDEVHKAMANTKRTSVCLNLSRMSALPVVLTGTPIISPSCQFLLPWLCMAMPFPVTRTNFWCAMNSIVSYLDRGETRLFHHEIPLNLEPERESELLSLFPTRAPWCGMHPHGEPTRDQWLRIKELSRIDDRLVQYALRYVMQRRDAATGIPTTLFNSRGGGLISEEWEAQRRILELQQQPGSEAQIREVELKVLQVSHMDAVESCRNFLRNHSQCTSAQAYAHFESQFQNVLLVAASWKHAVELARMCRSAGPDWMRVLLVGSNRSKLTLPPRVDHVVSADLTPVAVLDGAQTPYHLVIIPIACATGLSLSWCTAIVEAKYETNHANEQQAWGRICRADCQRNTRHVVRLLAGYTRVTQRHAEEAKQMMTALRVAGKKRGRSEE